MYIHKIEKDTYCPTEFGVNIFGNKWKPRILCLFSIKGTLRYKEIKASIPGITDNVLASTLRDLIAAELVTRVQYNEMPLRVEYSLSEKGESLIPVLRHICYWAITAYGQEVKGTAKTCPYAAQRENQKRNNVIFNHPRRNFVGGVFARTALDAPSKCPAGIFAEDFCILRT